MHGFSTPFKNQHRGDEVDILCLEFVIMLLNCGM